MSNSNLARLSYHLKEQSTKASKILTRLFFRFAENCMADKKQVQVN
jgi:hypothetical protein